MSTVILAALALAGAGVMPGSAQDGGHDTVRPSLVKLRAQAERTSGQVEQATAMGFVVSDNGLVLTSFSLISQLGDVKPLSVKIFGQRFGADEVRATEVDTMEKLDLLLLKLIGESDPVSAVDIGRSHPIKNGGDVFTSGFLPPNGYRTAERNIESRSPDNPRLWLVDREFGDGLVGSPVYTEAGDVIGIVSAHPKQIMSIDFAELLLTPVRVAEIEHKLAKLQDSQREDLAKRVFEIEEKIAALQQQYQWAIEWERGIDPQTNRPGLTTAWLYYKATLPGGSVPEKVSLRLTTEGISRDGDQSPLPTVEEELVRDRNFALSSVFDGRFEVPNAVDMKRFATDIYKLTEIRLRLDFNATLEDGTELPTERLVLQE